MTLPQDKQRLNERLGAVATLQTGGSRPIQCACECDDPGCHDFVRVAPGEYASARERHAYVVRSGHTISGARRIVIGPGYDVLKSR